MVALLVVASALFSAAGLALAAVGIGLLMRGDDAWMLGAIGVLPCYAAYLFGRAASRIRRGSKANPPTPAQKQARRRRVRDGVVFGVVVAAGSATAPVPTTVRVIGVIVAAVVVPLALAVEFEPSKRRRARRPS
jgi:hypothetical protein